MKKIIELKKVNKVFKKDQENIYALKDVTFTFELGKVYVIFGESGSGKTTLLNCISFIEDISSGEITIYGKSSSKMTEKEKIQTRQKIGFIFQDYFLDDYLKAHENVMLPLLLTKKTISECQKQAKESLDKIGLKERQNHYPKELSGGEKQRVAIARALITNPDILLADEPTGNLDVKNESHILNELKLLAKTGKCVIIVTHSKNVKKIADVILNMNHGILVANDEER